VYLRRCFATPNESQVIDITQLLYGAASEKRITLAKAKLRNNRLDRGKPRMAFAEGYDWHDARINAWISRLKSANDSSAGNI
jgi:hypothetical protein